MIDIEQENGTKKWCGPRLYLLVYRWRTHSSLVRVRHQMKGIVSILLEHLSLTVWWSCQRLKILTCTISSIRQQMFAHLSSRIVANVGFLVGFFSVFLLFFSLSFSSKHCGILNQYWPKSVSFVGLKMFERGGEGTHLLSSATSQVGPNVILHFLQSVVYTAKKSGWKTSNFLTNF